MPNWILRTFLEELGVDIDHLLSMPEARGKEDECGFHLSIDGVLPFQRTPIRIKQGDIEVEILITKKRVEA